jgi:FixJ family two-component response regulator
MSPGIDSPPPDTSAENGVVFVVDDDPLVRGALSSLFRSVGLRVQALESANALLQSQISAAPSCLVLDIRLPRLSGLDLQTELRNAGVMIPIIFITGHGDIPMSVQAMKAGAVDFLTKPFRDEEILSAVRAALERDRQRRAKDKSELEVRNRFALLTPRERQIMSLVTSGLMNKQIAAKIGITEMTVKIHRGRVMEKMQVKSLADLVLIADHLGVRGEDKA